MFKKALKKLSTVASRPKATKPVSQGKRLLTAEGWKRLMMKKYRK